MKTKEEILTKANQLFIKEMIEKNNLSDHLCDTIFYSEREEYLLSDIFDKKSDFTLMYEINLLRKFVNNEWHLYSEKFSDNLESWLEEFEEAEENIQKKAVKYLETVREGNEN
jgi:hypothetical protein